MTENIRPQETPEEPEAVLALQETESQEEDVQAHSSGGAISTLSAIATCGGSAE